MDNIRLCDKKHNLLREEIFQSQSVWFSGMKCGWSSSALFRLLQAKRENVDGDALRLVLSHHRLSAGVNINVIYTCVCVCF